jgi:ParB/RepB/Spo0J family partition protein
MTSGTFHPILISSITINRGERQRKALDQDHIDRLSASIRTIGLIHPIVVDRDHVLIAGECRTLACRQLGWTHISAQYTDELTPVERALIELEENVRRSDLTWQEKTLAVEEYHRLQKATNPTWRDEDTAKVINESRSTVTRHLEVAREIASPVVRNAATFKAAQERAKEIARRRDDSLVCISAPRTDTHILTESFLTWSSTPQPLFNALHIDFPYGIASHDSGKNPARYYDSADVYNRLFEALTTNLDNFCAPDAHILFWFSASAYTATWERLRALPFQFDEVPLVWHKSDSKGIAPDIYRRPRRVYETAFFGWRGDARTLKVADNTVSTPHLSGSHPHEKSEAALLHFFSIFVDTHTRLLDPTCGSGSALRAARAHGAQVLGLEIDERFADIARRSLEASSGSNLSG